jgi:hypothetical protein
VHVSDGLNGIGFLVREEREKKIEREREREEEKRKKPVFFQ